MSKRARERKVLLGIFLLLFAVVAVTAALHSRASQPLDRLYQNEQLRIGINDQETRTLSRQDLQSLPFHDFEETRRTSAGDASRHAYGGIRVEDVLQHAGIDPAAHEQVTVQAVDGYVRSIDMAQILADDQVYLVMTQDGQPLKTQEEGGDGPYLVVIRHEAFSQNWVKYLVEVKVS